MKNLSLSINRNNDHNSTEEISAFMSKDLKKCAFCNISIGKHSHIHIKNKNLYKSCSLCYYAENLDELKTLDNGCIIMMPELNQVELFSLIRMIWFIEYLEKEAKDDQHEELFDAVRNIESLIKERVEFTTYYYTSSIDNVNVLINFLYSINDDEYESRNVGLKNLLWLPNKKVFKDEIKYWIDSEYIKYQPKNFKKIINEIITFKKGKK
jgi:hypothetical protein